MIEISKNVKRCLAVQPEGRRIRAIIDSRGRMRDELEFFEKTLRFALEVVEQDASDHTAGSVLSWL